MQGDGEPLELKDAMQFAEAEARMILPGIQALFGFQLIAVFNSYFSQALDRSGQLLHLCALLLVALSTGLIMAPAACHRQADRTQVSPRLLRITSLLVGTALLPLALALSLDLYLVALVITDSAGLAAAIGAGALAVLLFLWIVLPQGFKRLRPPGPPHDARHA